MSRSNYSDDCDGPEFYLWRGAVRSAIRGTRGQALLREMRDALDAMPVKELFADGLVAPDGGVCALGVVGERRGMTDLAALDPEDSACVAKRFGVAEALVRELAFENDEDAPNDPAKRWRWMRDWVEDKLLPPPALAGGEVSS